MRSVILPIFTLIIGLVIGVLFISNKNTNNLENTTIENSENITVKKINWKMASTFAGSLTILGESGLAFSKRIDEVSDGSLSFKFFEPGALVPALEIFDAVSSGSVDAGWSTPGYWAGKVPALQFFAAIPFGPSPGEYLAWLNYGGGKKMFEEIYSKHNIHPIHCFMISPEASGWFRKEINSIDELVGLKMRFFGLGAKVMEKIGVSTQLLAGGDIFPALELGTIDATEFSMPVIDRDLGFYQVAKHYYFPGWHQPTSLGELIINLDKWNTLSKGQQAQIESTCGESLVKSLSQAEALQGPAIQELKAQGVTLHKWPNEILDIFNEKWLEVVEEEAQKDADFNKVWQSLKKFRSTYYEWKKLGYLE